LQYSHLLFVLQPHTLRHFKIFFIFDELLESLLSNKFNLKGRYFIVILLTKGYFPPKIDIQTRISGVQHKTQNFTLISNLLTVFYLVAYFQRYITFSDPCQKNEFFVNSKIFPLMLIFLPKEIFFLKCPNQAFFSSCTLICGISNLKKIKFYFFQKSHLYLGLDLPETYVAPNWHHAK